jgi:Galactose binding lectin domain
MVRALVILAASAAAALAQNPPPANPFCGYMLERNTVTLDLFCVNGVIDAVTSAFFGTPQGSCPSYVADPACDDPTFLAYAQAACVGHANCSLVSQGGDPCPGTVKAIAAVAHCSQPPGGWAPPSPPQPPQPPPSPTCSKNGVPCPPPTWTPTWNLTKSTKAPVGSHQPRLERCQPGLVPRQHVQHDLRGDVHHGLPHAQGGGPRGPLLHLS